MIFATILLSLEFNLPLCFYTILDIITFIHLSKHCLFLLIKLEPTEKIDYESE
jgi:hypothetical protein